MFDRQSIAAACCAQGTTLAMAFVAQTKTGTTTTC